MLSPVRAAPLPRSIAAAWDTGLAQRKGCALTHLEGEAACHLCMLGSMPMLVHQAMLAVRYQTAKGCAGAGLRDNPDRGPHPDNRH